MKKTSIMLSLLTLSTITSIHAEEINTLNGFSAIKLEIPNRVLNFSAKDMNDNGEVVGQITSDNSFSFEESLIGQGAYWNVSGSVSILPGHSFVTDLNGFASSINNSGQISGKAENRPTIWLNGDGSQREFLNISSTNAKEFLLDRNGTTISAGFSTLSTAPTIEQLSENLATLNNTFQVVSNNINNPSIKTSATAINNDQSIIGTFTTSESVSNFLPNMEVSHALLIRNNGQSFSLLGNLPASNSRFTPVDINDNEQIVGSDENAGIIWQDGLISRIGTLGGDISIATAINNKGQVLGSSKDINGFVHAFILDNSVMYDLSPALCETLEGCETFGISINNNNEILARVVQSGEKSIVKIKFTQNGLDSLPRTNSPLNFEEPIFFPENIVKSGELGTTSPEPTPEPSVVQNDFNGDGVEDRIILNQSRAFIEILDSNSNAISRIKLPVRSKKVIETADFNGDGVFDILAKGGKNELKIIFMHEDLSFSQKIFNFPRGSAILKIEDLNSDGSTDILIKSRNGSEELLTFN